MNLFELYAKITLDSSDYEAGIKKAVKQGEELRNQLKTGIVKAAKTAAAGIGVASSAVVALGKIGLNYNKQMESYTANFAVMLGDQEKAVRKVNELKELGARTPFEMTDLASATQTLLAFNVSADESSGILTKLGDISLGNVQKFESLTRAYGKMNASQKVSLEDINIMIDAGFNPLLLVAEKTGESMTQLYDRISKGGVAFEEVQDAIETATSAGGQFFNGMQEASKTTEGMISTLSDNIKSKIGEAFQSVSAIIQTSLLPEVIEFVDSIDTAKVVNAATNVVQVFKDMAPAVAGATAAIVAYKTAVSIVKLLDAFKKATEGMTVAQAALNVVMSANPFVLVATMVAGLIAALVTLYSTNEEFREKVNAAWNSVKEAVVKAATAFENALDKFFNFLVDLGPKIDDFLHSIPKKFVQIGSDMIAGLWNGISSKFSWLKDKVSGVVDGVKALFTGKDGFDVHSPSKWSEAVFRNVIDGGIRGLEYGAPLLASSVDDVMSQVKGGVAFSEVGYRNSAVDRSTHSLVGGITSALQSGGDFVVNLTSEIDGAILARKQYRYNLAESKRHGGNLIAY